MSSSSVRGLIAIVLFGAIALSVHAAGAAAWTGPATCRHEMPSGWTGRIIKWEGGCRDGRAQGLGVMRGYVAESRTAVWVFYGEVRQGRMTIGVIERPGQGVIAGEFREGQVVSTDDRETHVRAFQVAADAARQASERFEQQGNVSSARHYAERAHHWSEFMD